MKIKKMLRLSPITLLLIAAAMACAPAATPAPAPTVPSAPQTVAPTPTPAAKMYNTVIAPSSRTSLQHFYMWYGVEKGIHKQEGLNAKLIVVTPPVAVAGMIAGDIDFTTYTGSVVRSAALGTPLKAVMYQMDKLLFSLVVRPEIKTVADLKGKKVSVSGPTASDAYIAKFTAKASGLDPDKDITLIPGVDVPTRLAALLTGSVESAVLPLPNDVFAEQKGMKVLVWAEEANKYYSLAGVGVGTTEKLIKNNPDMVKRMIRATLKSIQYIKEHKDETVKELATTLNLDQPTTARVYDLHVKAYSPDGGIAESTIINEINLTKEAAKITQDVPVSKVADFSILKEVQKELGLTR